MARDAVVFPHPPPYGFAMRCLLILLLMHLLGWAGRAQAQTFVYHRDYSRLLQQSQNPASPSYYPTLLQRFQQHQGLTNEQVVELMVGYTGQVGFAPYDDLRDGRHLYELNENKQYAEAVHYGRQFLRKHPLNLPALTEQMYAYQQVNQADSAQYATQQLQALMQAMASTGDGRSAETAIFAIGPTDGQVYILRQLKARLGSGMGSGRDKQGNFVDILSVVSGNDDREKGYSLFFQIQPASASLLKELKKAQR